jgi:hypothetical protein
MRPLSFGGELQPKTILTAAGLRLAPGFVKIAIVKVDFDQQGVTGAVRENRLVGV